MAFDFELCDRRVKCEMKYSFIANILASIFVGFIGVFFVWGMVKLSILTGINIYFLVFIAITLLTLNVANVN